MAPRPVSPRRRIVDFPSSAPQPALRRRRLFRALTSRSRPLPPPACPLNLQVPNGERDPPPFGTGPIVCGGGRAEPQPSRAADVLANCLFLSCGNIRAVDITAAHEAYIYIYIRAHVHSAPVFGTDLPGIRTLRARAVLFLARRSPGTAARACKTPLLPREAYTDSRRVALAVARTVFDGNPGRSCASIARAISMITLARRSARTASKKGARA